MTWARALAGISLLTGLLVGCGGRLVPADRGVHGNLHAQMARAATPRLAEAAAPTVVLIERGGVRAVAPDDGAERWFRPLHVIGHPVAGGQTVYLPLRGHRLAAVDLRTGVIRWSTRLPGEALTGLCVAEGVVVAVVVDGSDRSRSRVVALSAEDAVVRWQRRSHARFGVPAARRRTVAVPLGDEVVAFRLSSGREVARVALPPATEADAEAPDLERMQAQDGALMVGGGNRFVNLLSATAGQAPAPQRIDTGHGWIFPPIEGLDPGHDDAERLRLWVRFAVSGEAPRGAVMLARRAVVAMRLAPDGRPVRARWVHLGAQDLEYVAMDVGPSHVTLVREDGAVVTLDAHDGAVTQQTVGQRPTRGALLVAMPATPTSAKTPGPTAVRGQLAALFRDGDPRLVPAQVLAADLLWRTDDVDARAEVEALANGTRTVGTGDAAAGLQTHALTLLSGPWGSADGAELQTRLAHLADRPSFLASRSLQLAPLARAAVHSGNAQMVPHLVEHLLHPATAASDLAEIARALAILGGPAATTGLAAFVRRYHADPEVVYESRALHIAVEHLACQPEPDPSPSGQDGARATLAAALLDPFTEPDLRAYIAARMGRDAGDGVIVTAASTSLPRASTPPAGEPSDAGRIPPVLPTVHPAGL